MLKTIVLFFFLSSANLYSQSNLEVEVLKALNHYRARYNLSPVKISQNLQNVSNHHSLWMSKVGFSALNHLMTIGNKEELDSHYETIDIPNFKEIFSPKDRGEFYGALENITNYSEVCSMTKSVDSKNPFFLKKIPDNELAKNIIVKFSNSIEHNEVMLQNTNLNSQLLVGISVIVDKDIAYTTIFFVEK